MHPCSWRGCKTNKVEAPKKLQLAPIVVAISFGRPKLTYRNFQPLELFERPNQGSIANCLAKERNNTFKEFYVCSNCTYFVELWPQLCSLNTYKSLHLLSIIGILLSKLQQTSFELSHSAISASATMYAFRSSGLIPKSSPLGTTKSDPLHWSVGTQLERK